MNMRPGHRSENMFLFLSEDVLASGNDEIEQILAQSAKNNNKKSPTMFIEVWKLSCINPVQNARCPSGLQRLTL